MTKNHYKAVLFDFGGTLDGNGMAWYDRLLPLYHEEGAGLSTEEASEFAVQADTFLTGQKKLRGLGYRDTILSLNREIVRLAGLKRPGLPERVTDKFVAGALKSLEKARKVLERLHKTYRLGVVSNFYGNLDSVFKEIHLDPFFEVVADSQRLGVSKPDPRIFAYVLREMELKPDQCLMVGDALSKDMAGARSIGMPHAWLFGDRFKASKPGEACCKGDPVLKSLDDLSAHLS